MGRKYACLVLPAVLMPRRDFCPLGQVVWGLVGAKVRLLRPTSCANAPWWFSSLFRLCGGRVFEFGLEVGRTGKSFFQCWSTERLCWVADERGRNFSAVLGRCTGTLLGRKYAYLVLPTVLMPRAFGAGTVYPCRATNSSLLWDRIRSWSAA